MGRKRGGLAFQAEIVCLSCLNITKQVPAFGVVIPNRQKKTQNRRRPDEMWAVFSRWRFLMTT